MDVPREACPPRWPATPGAVFTTSCYIAIVGWAVAMGIGLSQASNELLTLACMTSLVAGSLWWRILYQLRRKAFAAMDFQGSVYREKQMEALALAFLAWVGPRLFSGTGWLWGIVIVFVIGLAYYHLTQYVTSKWPARP